MGSGGESLSNLSQQILRANPILEAFGNAQTVRNNNSSRFGKFIRIQFTRSGQIAGASIDWYLLEKSRVVKLNPKERNYHIFYQLLRGADGKTKRELLLEDKGVDDFEYTKHGNDTIAGVSDDEEWNSLIGAFNIMGFSAAEQQAILRTIAAVLHVGNIIVTKESLRGDQASFDSVALAHAEKVCRLLGISQQSFVAALLHPRVKAGREWVERVQTPDQVRLSIEALAKGIYERGFADLVDRINRRLNRASATSEDTHFIGVLDIAGFEIFETNSFEQLCINYTNEKLQQFFNHHMFVLEQEEYAREQIEWQFIDFGRDLQPTIDLIEVTNPIGIFSCLDEDSVMPKATDKSFTEKLHALWDRKTPKYRRSLLTQGFMLTHYAAEVEYSTDGWLDKNKDPLNDNVTRVLAASSDKQVSHLFVDCADPDDEVAATRNRVKRGPFRTVAQRHKEQLSTLMGQLHSTHPHFVRCILPNHKKRPKSLNGNLVLDQLRCNGVLEGIRIARTGFPNRLPFSEFRARYEVLCSSMPRGYIPGQTAASMILEKLSLDPSFYRVGLTKVFFRAGVLAELEEQRNTLIRQIMTRFQSVARGCSRRRAVNKQLYRVEAARIIQKNFQVYVDLQANPWWRLFVRMRPLLGATKQSAELKKRDETIQKLEMKMQQDASHSQTLQEERRRADLEVSKIQQTLESERALAFDKEEIFKRQQDRETELTEKLAGALDDQGSLEDQIDKLMLSKQQALERVGVLHSELAQAATIMGGFEEEKTRLLTQISDLNIQVTSLEESRSQTGQAEECFNQEIRMLQSQLGLKARKIQDFENQILKVDQDLEIKLSATSKELQASKKQVEQLSEDNGTIREQLAQLSSTSTEYEDILRLRESELVVLKAEVRRLQSDRQIVDEENRQLFVEHDNLKSRLRDMQGETSALKAYTSQLEHEATDTKQLLEDRSSEDAQSGFKIQIHDLEFELNKAQSELNRERQSRDDVQMLADHKFNHLKRDYDSLNQSKITIEKELYVNSDILRKSNDARATAEKERREHQEELRTLRHSFLELQTTKLDAESAGESSSSRLTNERQAALRLELEAVEQQLEASEEDRKHLNDEVQRLNQLIIDSDIFKVSHDQRKDRLERELLTIKGRLVASENDNRVLLNKIQQKNLDIARSHSRASDTQRSRISQLQTENSNQEEDKKRLARQLEEAQLTITSLEKQKDKLALTLEDLTIEIAREHKTSRNAEKTSSTASLQLAEANRKLEAERQLTTQVRSNSRTIENSLDKANKELIECHNQLALMHKAFGPETIPGTYQDAKVDMSKGVDLVRKWEAADHSARIATERYARAEAQLGILRERQEDEMTEVNTRHVSSKRALLEEMNHSQVNTRLSPSAYRNISDFRNNPENRRPSPGFSTPVHRHISNTASDSARSDHTVDTVSYNTNMDLVSELELVQNQLQMSEMRNRHLESQVNRSPDKRSINEDNSPSLRRAQRLERENFRLHDMLDDSAKKVSRLENTIRTGQLSLKEVQTKTYEELYDLINSQEQSRRTLLQVHNAVVDDLVQSKEVFEEIKQSKATLEFELRDARSELVDLQYERDQNAASRNQLLEEYSDLQVKLDAETSKLADMTSSFHLYKSRAEDYYHKLEHAEVAVLKASRSAEFAKTQGRESEDMCATILSERKELDNLVEDLQRQVQSYEERAEDLTADLESALQARKRLQNELEDYRNHRAHDIEDKEMSMEQTRRKYQTEISTVTDELENERQNTINMRGECHRLRDDLEKLKIKWDNEALNSSTWAKEKSRLEITVENLSKSRDEAANAYKESQTKIVALLGQVRFLRSSVDDVGVERDALAREKKILETRLNDAGERLEELSRSESPSTRNAATADRELLQLKAGLAQQEDIASAAVGKMRRSEALLQEIQKDFASERETNAQLRKEKAGVDKSVKDLQLRLLDLETKGYSATSQDVRFLHGRIQEVRRILACGRSIGANSTIARKTTRRAGGHQTQRGALRPQRRPHRPRSAVAARTPGEG